MTSDELAPKPRDIAEALLADGDPASAFAELADVQTTLTGDDLYFGARLALLCGHNDTALDWLDQAHTQFNTSGAPLMASRTQLGRINVLHELGRNHDSIVVAEGLRCRLDDIAVDRLSTKDQDLHRWLRASLAVNLGAVLGVVGRHNAAVEALTQARALYVDTDSPGDRALVQANLGLELLNTGRDREAEEALALARTQFSDLDDQWLLYRCIVYQSQAVAATGRYGSALQLLEEADRVIDRFDLLSSPDALRSRLARAQVQVSLNLFPEVLDHCAALRPVLSERSMTHDLAQCNLLQAMALLGLGRTEEALEPGAHSVELFLEADLPVRSAHARITFARCLDPTEGCTQIDESISVLGEAGELRRLAEAALTGADLAPDTQTRIQYLDLADESGALEAPELAWRSLWHRSRVVPKVDQRSELLDRSLEIQRSIRNDLATDYLRAPFLVNRRHPLESRLELHLSHGETNEAFELSSNYRAWTLSPSIPSITVQPLRVATAAKQTNLLYQSIGNRLICFVATTTTHNAEAATDRVASDSTHNLELIDLGQVLDHVSQLMLKLEAEWRHLADPRLRVHLNALRPVAERVLQQLYLAVFAKVEQHIPEDSAVTIIPTGRTAALPFAALHDGSSYLHERRTISLSPGVSTRGTPAPNSNRRIAVIGLPDHRAPNIGLEVEQIHEITSGELLYGSAATADAARQAAEDAGVIHLAGHSNFRPENPWLSSFSFADRDVTAAELADWDLNDATVILASCSSGRQSNLGEDELLGLPRALLLAGARELVVNLWNVDDTASVGMMSHLHQELQHNPLSQALRSAQTATHELHPHPYFWAAPLHYTNPNTTQSPRSA